MLDYREPPNGDFVAFVEKIEREQLARTMQSNKQSPPGMGDASAGSRSLSATEAQRVLQSLRNEAAAGSTAARGALIGAAIGAALIAFGLIAEGGFILVIVGAVLLWHNLRKLARHAAVPAVKPAAARAIDRTFGKAPSKTTRESGR